MRPMSEFDPWLPAVVHDHDRLNDQTFEWLPEWQINHERHLAFRAGSIAASHMPTSPTGAVFWRLASAV